MRKLITYTYSINTRFDIDFFSCRDLNHLNKWQIDFLRPKTEIINDKSKVKFM